MNAQGYEAWRPALIAFYQAESPWMTQTLEGLRRGDPLTAENKRAIEALIAAFDAKPQLAVAA
jgi:hypothetical protein